VDRDRMHTARNHTCTHMLHAALRRVLGDYVKQSGSLVAPDRLRFDFTHISPLSEEEIRAVEDEVNDAILRDLPVGCREVDYEQAEQEGAVGLFEDKYQERVRIVEVPHVSKELCGGVHLEQTGQAGSFYILSETGVSSGVRRIEAATGWNAVLEYRKKRDALAEAAQSLRASPEDVAGKAAGLLEQIKQLEREKEELQAKQLSGGGDLLDRCEEVGGVRLLATKMDLPESSDMKGLRSAMDDLRSRLSSGVILLGAENRGKAHLLLFVSPDLQGRFTAPELVQEVAREVGGSGGGRPELAQAGGGNPEGIDRALQRLREIIEEKGA
jgi:alanyl-tRNA synthetase